MHSNDLTLQRHSLLPEICYGRQANVITAGGLAHTMGFNCVAAEQLLKWSRVSVFLLFGHYTASGWSRTSRQPLVPRKDTVPLVHPEPSLCHLPVKGSWFLDLKTRAVQNIWLKRNRQLCPEDVTRAKGAERRVFDTPQRSYLCFFVCFVFSL